MKIKDMFLNPEQLFEKGEELYKQEKYKDAFEYYAKAAEKGNIDAQYKLGKCYENGDGIDKSRSTAIYWYKLAAEQGDERALYNLGCCYYFGDADEAISLDIDDNVFNTKKAIHCFFILAQNNDEDDFEELRNITNDLVSIIHNKKNVETALDSLKYAADIGYGYAQYQLGLCYLNGNGIEKNEETAMYWFEHATNQQDMPNALITGKSDAQLQLGIYHLNLGTEKGYQDAVKWFRQLVAEDNEDAKVHLGVCYFNGYGVEQNKNKAAQYFKQALPIDSITGVSEECLSDTLAQLGDYFAEQDCMDYNPREAFFWYSEAAKKGSVRSQSFLGYCYEFGYVAEKNLTKAIYWNTCAAKQGDSEAQYRLGVYYHKLNTADGYKKAFDWYQLAAAQNNIEAQYNLGYCYEHGKGIEKDEKTAVQWYTLAAKQGNANAQYNLGFCYKNGIGTEINLKQSIYRFSLASKQGDTKAYDELDAIVLMLSDEIEQRNSKDAFYTLEYAAEQGVASAQFNLGVYYASGICVKTSLEEALFWYNRASKQNYNQASAELNKIINELYNNIKNKNDEKSFNTLEYAARKQEISYAQNALGYCYHYGTGIERDEKAAAHWFTLAANQGNAQAQFRLGVCYYYGRGVEKDEKAAAYWYTLAANQGNAQAQCNLGICYECGTGVEKKDEKAAVHWYTLAADQGNASAQCNLGACYKYGSGVEKDEKAAVHWYTLAADQGNAQAQCNLGICYEYGTGVEKKDEKAAVHWYTLAADQGNASAQCNLGVCYLDGNGVEQDLEKASGYFKKHIDRVSAESMIRLADYYADIYSKNHNHQEAFFWYSAAAEKDNAEAKRKLGRCYEEGLGTIINIQMAYDCYTEAILKQDSTAIDLLWSLVKKEENNPLQAFISRTTGISLSEEKISLIFKETIARIIETNPEIKEFSKKGYDWQKAFIPELPEEFKKVQTLFSDIETNIKFFDIIYQFAIDAEEKKEINKAILLHYFAAQLGCQKSIYTIINMGMQNSTYFYNLESLDD